jgi:hypothetical protein
MAFYHRIKSLLQRNLGNIYIKLADALILEGINKGLLTIVLLQKFASLKVNEQKRIIDATTRERDKSFKFKKLIQSANK